MTKIRTHEEFAAQYGYVATTMVKRFAELCELTETVVGQVVIQKYAEIGEVTYDYAEQLVLDGTLTQQFVEHVHGCIEDLKKEDAHA